MMMTTSCVMDDPERLAQTCAKSELWLATNPLNRATVLDYLAITHFYDPACVNEAAVAAGRHRSETQCAPSSEATCAAFALVKLLAKEAHSVQGTALWSRRLRVRRHGGGGARAVRHRQADARHCRCAQRR